MVGAAVKSAGLVERLLGAGPITVFAPTSKAFARLPAAILYTLLKPESKGALTKALRYHHIAGKMSSKDLLEAIRAGNGTAISKTVSGGTRVARAMRTEIAIADEKGGMSKVTISDVH